MNTDTGVLRWNKGAANEQCHLLLGEKRQSVSRGLPVYSERVLSHFAAWALPRPSDQFGTPPRKLALPLIQVTEKLPQPGSLATAEKIAAFLFASRYLRGWNTI